MPPSSQIAHCLSYAPLLRGQPGVSLAEEVHQHPGRLQQLLGQAASGLAKACAWVMHGGELLPALVYDHGDDIHAHLLEWAEGDPPSWFSYHIESLPASRSEPPGYVLVLHPHLTKSVDRFERAFPRDSLDRATVEVIYSPLWLVASGTSFHDLRHRLGPTSRLGLLDARHFDPDRPGDFDPDKVRLLGPFPVLNLEPLGGVEAFLRQAAQLPR